MENLGRTTSVVSDAAFSVSSANTEDVCAPQNNRKSVRIADRIIAICPFVKWTMPPLKRLVSIAVLCRI